MLSFVPQKLLSIKSKNINFAQRVAFEINYVIFWTNLIFKFSIKLTQQLKFTILNSDKDQSIMTDGGGVALKVDSAIWLSLSELTCSPE